MIESHFNLRRRAFPALPDPSCYYPATGHEIALDRLIVGLSDGEGLLVLTGAPGLGKTLLAHCLLDRLGVRPGEGYDLEAVFLANTQVRDRAGLLQALLYDLSLPHENRSEQDMRLALIDHVLSRYTAGTRTLLLIDEAHHLGIDHLEEIRMLGNLEGKTGKAVQVVLIAQEPLLDTIARPELASLRQRIAVSQTLSPLSVEESADYVLHHLRTASGRSEQPIDPEALELLAERSGGVPRLINRIAHQALRLASEAAQPLVDVEVVLEALAVLGLTVDEVEETTDTEERNRLLGRSA